jgi:hypothetical protein
MAGEAEQLNISLTHKGGNMSSRNRRVICAFVGLLLASCAYGQNVVTDWAAIVQPAVNTPPKAPVYQMVLRAMIQIAVYDAVVAIEGGYQPFAATIASTPGADVRAAVATAAWKTARSRVDSSQISYLDSQYANYLAAIPNSQSKEDGIQVGKAAATAILQLRSNDGFGTAVQYQCSSNPPPPGEFEPDGGCGTQPVAVNAGQIKPFTFADPAQFRPDGPTPLTSSA